MGSQKTGSRCPAPGCVKRKQLGLGLKTWICFHYDDFAQMAPGLENTSGKATLVRGVAHRMWVCEGGRASVVSTKESQEMSVTGVHRAHELPVNYALEQLFRVPQNVSKSTIVRLQVRGQNATFPCVSIMSFSDKTADHL